jgi:Viral BACON domain/Putative binding domain, N-terminal
MDPRLRNVIVLVAALSGGIASCGGEQESPTEPTPICTIAISPPSATFGSDGGSGAVTVTTSAGCAWSVTSNASWISVTAGATGNGPGTVTYTVTANSSIEPRNGSLTIGGANHAIAQQGRPLTVCTYELSPGSAAFLKDAAAGSFTVAAPADCSWTASSNASWLVVTSGNQGSGNGTVSYTVARNVDVAERNAAIAVADRRFTVSQSGDGGSCQYAVAPVDVTPCMPGGSVTATVTTQPFCPWTAASGASWLTVAAGASGSGPGAITMTFSDNYDAPRQGIIMVRWPTPTAGQNIRVAQAGCLYAVSRGAFSFTATAGSGTFDVIQQSVPNTCGSATQDRCVWTAQSTVAWITVTTGMPRSGDNPVAFAVAANDGPASRTGTIIVRDKVVVVTQAGK